MGKFNHDYKVMQSIDITGADYTLIHANNHIAMYIYYIILSYVHNLVDDLKQPQINRKQI